MFRKKRITKITTSIFSNESKNEAVSEIALPG
jgi:hypothetical protein